MTIVFAAGTKPSGGGGGGADWLGLGGDDDGGLDLGAGSLKRSTPSSQEGKKDTSIAQGIFLRTINKLFICYCHSTSYLRAYTSTASPISHKMTKIMMRRCSFRESLIHRVSNQHDA